MLKIVGIIFILISVIKADSKITNFSEVSEVDGLIYKESLKFTGVFLKRNLAISVKNGKINKLEVSDNSSVIASFDIKNNQFNGKAYVNHRVLGLQNLIYNNGCIEKIETKNYKESFEDCNFKEGITNSNEKYFLSSKYPYVYELDVFSFNINAYLFKKKDKRNGVFKSKEGQRVYQDSKVRRLIVGVPQAGLNYVISFDKNQSVVSIMKFFMDSRNSVIAYFKNDDLSHIISFDKDVSQIEKYEKGKLISKINNVDAKNLEFDLFEYIDDVLVKMEDGISHDIYLEE